MVENMVKAENVKPIRKKAAYIAQMDAEQKACRAFGHDWPSKKMRPGRALPKGVRAVRGKFGNYYLREMCSNGCGRERTVYGLGADDYGLGYKSTKRWITVPLEVHLTPTDLKLSVYEDMMPVIRKEAISEDEAEASSEAS